MSLREYANTFTLRDGGNVRICMEINDAGTSNLKIWTSFE